MGTLRGKTHGYHMENCCILQCAPVVTAHAWPYDGNHTWAQHGQYRWQTHMGFMWVPCGSFERQNTWVPRGKLLHTPVCPISGNHSWGPWDFAIWEGIPLHHGHQCAGQYCQGIPLHHGHQCAGQYCTVAHKRYTGPFYSVWSPPFSFHIINEVSEQGQPCGPLLPLMSAYWALTQYMP